MNLYIVQQQNSPNHAFVSDQTKCINVSIGIVNVMDGIISFIVVHHCTINTVHDADIPHVTLQRSKMIYESSVDHQHFFKATVHFISNIVELMPSSGRNIHCKTTFHCLIYKQKLIPSE